MTDPDFSTYVSPLAWRYGTPEMKRIFSEEHKYRLWRRVWVALARAQQQAGLVTQAELDDLLAHEEKLDIPRIVAIEEETRHDVVSGIREFAEKTAVGGGKIHLGATSMDVVDNTDVIRQQEALALVERKVREILDLFAAHIDRWADVPCIGYTHLQPAEPTTVGYRLAFYAQDLLLDLDFLGFVRGAVKGKGMKGAVGTRASYTQILERTGMTAEALDQAVARELGIETALITSQVYPRKYDYLTLTLLAGIASSLAKFAGDLRILQSPTIGEWAEPFGKKQVGSSAMPFKKNPVNSEKICSLARYIAHLPGVALENATLSYLERTLDDSANKRLIMSEAYIALDEILKIAGRVVAGLVFNTERITYNLHQFAPFAATESLIIAAVKRGADRQEMHELLRTLSLEAWSAVSRGQANPLPELLKADKRLRVYLQPADVDAALDVAHHVGDAPGRAKRLVALIRKRTGT